MLCFHKQSVVPQAFAMAVEGINTYSELDGNPSRKLAVLKVLMNEQGCLCPFCERRITFPRSETNERPATIDHFFPQSRFHEIEINYFNLIAVCTKCNNPKDNHLIPGYFFDSMFCPFSSTSLFATESNGRHGLYRSHLEGGSKLEVRPYFKAFESGKYAMPHHSLLQNTIELLDLNRENLQVVRKEAIAELIRATTGYSDEQLLGYWQTLKSGAQIIISIEGEPPFSCQIFEQLISLKMDFLKNKLRRHQIANADNFRDRLGDRFEPCQCE